MKQFIMTLTFFAFGLLCAPRVFACAPSGSVDVVGPISCGIPIVNSDPANNLYTAFPDFSAPGCVYYEWTITGGVQTGTGLTTVRRFIAPPCTATNIGSDQVATDATLDNLEVTWTPGAPVRSLSVRMFQDGGFLFSDLGTLLVEEAFNPISLTRTNCTDEHVVGMPSGATACPPAFYRWIVDGVQVNQDTPNSFNFTPSNPNASYSMTVEVLYDEITRTISRTFRPLFPTKSIIGPNIICPESTNAFTLSFAATPAQLPQSVQWLSSTGAVTFTNPNDLSTDLIVSSGLFPPSFTLSCTTVTCGVSDVQMRTIQILPAGDISCPPIALVDPNNGEEADQVRGVSEGIFGGTTNINLTDANTPQRIYPNPVKFGEQLYLPLDCPVTSSTDVEVIDMTGRIISSYQKMDALDNTISTSSLPSTGTYMVRVGNDCGVKTYKVTVIK